jgi:periplasmic divalent cation tolerance protein
VESAQEWLLLIKTTAQQFSVVRDAIAELHSCDTPECIGVTIEEGSAAYLKWLVASVEPDAR